MKQLTEERAAIGLGSTCIGSRKVLMICSSHLHALQGLGSEGACASCMCAGCQGPAHLHCVLCRELKRLTMLM